jgi:hypothetical protein
MSAPGIIDKRSNGSKAELKTLHFDVCFTPESAHVQCTSLCLLWARSGHCFQLFDHLVGAGKH